MRFSRLILLAGTALCAPSLPLLAQAPAPNTLPSGGSVLAGQASIATPAPNRMQVTQGSDRAVIGWQSFSIGSNAAVDIRQPGPGSISVQQVQGTDPSRIFGALTSNGRVVVANPAGVWFGPEARVDAAGIAAGAGRMSQGAIGQFMADGQVRLDQGAAPGAQVVNEGRITVSQGGLAALVGPTARNAGTIEARLGRVQIAGGEAATVDFDGDGLIAVRAAPGALAENTGRISADGGRVRMTVAEAKGVLAGAVNMAGVVEARSVAADGGGITLGGVHAEAPTVTVAGRVDASGPRGGTVALLGNDVTVRAGARVDASGQQAGGTIRVGGDARGAAGTRTARTSRVEQGAVLAADATVAGPGGSVVIWADDRAFFGGSISARGAGEGPGGFAEVSGRGGFTYGGTADLTAPSGRWGTLLLDPAVITIVASGGTDTVPDPATPGNVNLNAGAVEAALGSANVVLEATDTIAVNAPLRWTTASTLSLIAGNSVTINAPITNSGSGGLTVMATADTAFVRGNISLAAGARSVTGADVSVGRAVTVIAGRDVILCSRPGTVETGDSFGRIVAGTGMIVRAGRDVIVGTGTGASTNMSTPASNVLETLGGTQTITADRNIIVQAGGQNAEARIRAAGDQVITAGGRIDVFAAGSAALITAGASQTIRATGAITLRGGSAGAFRAEIANIGGAQAITTVQALDLSAGAGLARIANSGGDQTVTAGSARVSAAGALASILNAGGAQTLRATSGAVLIQAGANAPATVANLGGEQVVSAATTLDLIAGAGSGNATITNGAGGQSISAGNDISLTGKGGHAAILANGGPQTLSAGGTIRLGAGATATPLGLSEATPTGAPTRGSASVQSIPGTAPGVADGAANQTITAAGIAFTGPAGAAVIALQDLRAINDSPVALPRYQSVLAGGTQLSLVGSTTVMALVPPPGPPVPPPGGGAGPAVPAGTVDATANALRLVTASTPPQPVAETLAAGTGGFTPAGLAEGEGFQPAAVIVEGEDPAAAFANTMLATRVDGLLPPPVPYFAGYVPPPIIAAR
jgi:filamentous hemagglutinin family protein